MDSINRINRPRYIFAPVKNKDMDFQRHMSWSFIVFSELMGEAIVRFVDIGGIVDYHCLNFLFKNMKTLEFN